MAAQYNASKSDRIFAIPEGEMGKEITPFWEKSFSELKIILLDWLQEARSVWVFSYDDPFLSSSTPVTSGHSFNLEGHDILILQPEELSVEFLHAAFFYSSPLEIFKSNKDDQYIKDVFVQSLLPNNERLRDSDFTIRKLFDSFGEFISVTAWTYLYRIEEQDLCQGKS